MSTYLPGVARPFWIAYLFGGNYDHATRGSGRYPGVLRMARRFYAEGWRRAGYSLLRFIAPPARRRRLDAFVPTRLA